jgi:hypothetical protein
MKPKFSMYFMSYVGGLQDVICDFSKNFNGGNFKALNIYKIIIVIRKGFYISPYV